MQTNHSIKRPIDCVYFILSTNVASGIDALLGLSDMAIPDTITILYFYDRNQVNCRAKQILDDYEVEFPTEKPHRIHLIPSESILNDLLVHLVRMSNVVAKSALFLLLLSGSESLIAIQSTCSDVFKQIEAERPFQIASQNMSTVMPMLPIINDIQMHALSRLPDEHRSMFQTTMEKILKILRGLPEKTIFTAGKFDISMNLKFLPFSPLLIFNQLVRRSVLVRAPIEELAKIVSKNKHIIHLLNKNTLDLPFDDFAIRIAVPVIPIMLNSFMMSPQSPSSVKPADDHKRRVEFERKLKLYVTKLNSVVQYDKITPFNTVADGTHVENLLKFYEIHFASEPTPEFATDRCEKGNFICQVKVSLGQTFESDYFSSEKDAKEAAAFIACTFFQHLQTSALKIGKFSTGPLGNFLLNHGQLSISEKPFLPHFNSKVLLHEYVRLGKMEYPEANMELCGKQFKGSLTLYGITWETRGTHVRKSDAKLDLTDQVVKKLCECLDSRGQLNYSKRDFE